MRIAVAELIARLQKEPPDSRGTLTSTGQQIAIAELIAALRMAPPDVFVEVVIEGDQR